jgi:hypothetical protein
MQGVMDRNRFATDPNLLAQICIGQPLESREENVPSFSPPLPELCVSNSAVIELRIALTPRLLAVGGEELREVRP